MVTRTDILSTGVGATAGVIVTAVLLYALADHAPRWVDRLIHG